VRTGYVEALLASTSALHPYARRLVLSYLDNMHGEFVVLAATLLLAPFLICALLDRLTAGYDLGDDWFLCYLEAVDRACTATPFVHSPMEIKYSKFHESDLLTELLVVVYHTC